MALRHCEGRPLRSAVVITNLIFMFVALSAATEPGDMYCEKDVAELIASRDFPPLKNDRILKAARGEVPDRLPVWIMRQAGRYLPEYKKFTQSHTFFEICQTPALSCQVTLMPIERYDLDAAIIFSDILVVPQAIGLEVVMEPGRGPVFPKPLTLDMLPSLNWNDTTSRLRYVGQAITLTRHKLDGKVPIIGFAGAPWTLMVFSIEGGGTKTASKAKRWLYAHPVEAQQLLSRLAEVVVEYLVMQVESGAQMVQLFESSGEYLSKATYSEFILPHVVKIGVEIKKRIKERNLNDVPLIFFAKGGHLLGAQLDAGFDVVSVDWTVDPKQARALAGTTPLQGNLDPCALYADKEELVRRATEMVESFGYANYIVNLGHGIYPDMDPESVQTLIETVHSFKPPK